ncbi:hypothetical protein DL96DRAFT_1595982 [Flagelloscypha sp. PMI_526]|nr:hypothetical protein DL96DRAFT_1595982 [Flagelloscypha sp. PMI_526]
MSVTPILTAEHAEIPGTVAQVYSHLNSDEQQEMFERTIAATGSRQAAEERFQAYVHVLEAQGTATICVPKPPEGVRIAIDHYWSIQIVLPPWSRTSSLASGRGYLSPSKPFPIGGMILPFFLVAANARVRISYRDESQEKKIEEVVFPPASGRPHIPVRYLQ